MQTKYNVKGNLFKEAGIEMKITGARVKTLNDEWYIPNPSEDLITTIKSIGNSKFKDIDNIYELIGEESIVKNPSTIVTTAFLEYKPVDNHLALRFGSYTEVYGNN